MRNLSREIRNRFDSKFGAEVKFLRNWIGSPKSVGAIWPSSAITAKRMTEVINVDSGLPVLELGPGTGVITKAILDRGVQPENLYSVEYSAKFLLELEREYPEVNFLQGDAFDVDSIVEKSGVSRFDSVISGLPLLNFPPRSRVQMIERLLDHLPPGRPIVQFCYGPRSPVAAGRGDYRVEHYDWIARNVPPARLWIYSR